jgi:tRNA threonylcarbamoyladenosine biosynthesis protein TsaB
MNILAFDTATTVTSVAVGAGGAVIAEISITGDRVQMENLMPMIDGALREAGLKINDIDGIAVGIGPGLFTALRIGVTTANTLSQVLKVPVAGVRSLDILAAGIAYRPGLAAAAIDARRGEVFASIYEVDGVSAVRILPARVMKPVDFAAELAEFDQSVSLAGDGFVAHEGIFRTHIEYEGNIASPEFMYPRASALIGLAEPILKKAKTGEPGLVFPDYIRNPDADEHIKRMKR